MKMRPISKIHEIATKLLTGYLNSYLTLACQEHRPHHPDLVLKLDQHIPAVAECAKIFDPNDTTLHLAAGYHDFGRIEQFERFRSFADGRFGSETDHHEIGYRSFIKRSTAILMDGSGLSATEYLHCLYETGLVYQISQVIHLHGLRGYAFQDEFEQLDARTSDLVDKVSLLDDLVNGAQCASYILMEAQQHAKDCSMGGFIPDENATSTEATVMKKFLADEKFDRNIECSTYPDYLLYNMAAITRALKGDRTRVLIKTLLNRPLAVYHYMEDSEVSNTTGSAGRSLVRSGFQGGMLALEYVCYEMMNSEQAAEALEHLRARLI